MLFFNKMSTNIDIIKLTNEFLQKLKLEEKNTNNKKRKRLKIKKRKKKDKKDKKGTVNMKSFEFEEYNPKFDYKAQKASDYEINNIFDNSKNNDYGYIFTNNLKDDGFLT